MSVPVQQHWRLYDLRNDQGALCGCARFLAKAPATAACPIHARHKPEQGHFQVVEALRQVGYTGRVFLQYPMWSMAGKHLSKRPNGLFYSAPAYAIDMVLEASEGAARACNVAQLVGVEVDGIDHKAATTQVSDRVKEQCAKVAILRVDIPTVVHEGDGDWEAEADRILRSLYK
jgi:hypothetical protein